MAGFSSVLADVSSFLVAQCFLGVTSTSVRRVSSNWVAEILSWTNLIATRPAVLVSYTSKNFFFFSSGSAFLFSAAGSGIALGSMMLMAYKDVISISSRAIAAPSVTIDLIHSRQSLYPYM